MNISIPVDTINFSVEIDHDGITHLVFQLVGGMPVADAQDHGALNSIWRALNLHPQVKVVLLRNEGKVFCAGGALGMVEYMVHSEQSRMRVMR